MAIRDEVDDGDFAGGFGPSRLVKHGVATITYISILFIGRIGHFQFQNSMYLDGHRCRTRCVGAVNVERRDVKLGGFGLPRNATLTRSSVMSIDLGVVYVIDKVHIASII